MINDRTACLFAAGVHELRMELKLDADELIAGLLGCLTAACEECDYDALSLLLQMQQTQGRQ